MTQRRFLIGVCGGIAAYKSLIVIRGLLKAGHEVRVVPTPAALKMVGAPSFAALAQQPIHSSVFDDPTAVEHVALADWATDLVIVPATANTIAKLAHGFADNLLTAVALATKAELTLAPAMHAQMWEAAATRANLALLRQRGASLIGPVTGALSSGDFGVGRMTEPEQILQTLLHPDETSTNPVAPAVAQDLSGLKVLVTAGGTHEPIDPVRYIGNNSSGRQGCAVAAAALKRGAEVELVAANIAPDLLPTGAKVTRVTTAAELAKATHAAAANAQLIVMTAAVADFTPVSVSSTKLVKKNKNYVPTIELEQTEDVLLNLCKRRLPGQLIVGFSAETGTAAAALTRAKQKAARKGSDFTVVNVVGDGVVFDQPGTAITIIDAAGDVVSRFTGGKLEAANALLDVLAKHLPDPQQPRK